VSLLLKMIDDISTKILAPIKRFPLATLSAFIFTLLMVIDGFHRGELEIKEMVDKITFVSMLAFFFFISLRLIKKGWIPSIVGLILVVSYYFYLPPTLNEYMGQAEGTTIAPLMFLILFFLMFVSPFFNYKISNRAFFEWFKHIIYTLLLSATLSIFLFIVLNVGWGIIKKLFDLNQHYWYNNMIGFFSFSFIGVLFFLSHIVKEPREIEQKEYNSIETFFVKYILTSIFILYFIIIYAYTGKMIVLAEYPNGIISLHIIIFSILAILTYLFWTPLWNEKNEKYKKVIWIAIILQTILLAMALYLRIEPYGWTLSRVIISSIGVWLFTLSLYALVKKKFSYQIMFLSVPLLLIINLIFASSISKTSQQDRLGVLLANNSSLSNESNISLLYNVSSKINYLYRHYGTEALFPLIPLIVTEYRNQINNITKNDCAISPIHSFPIYATDKLGFNYINKWDWKNYQNSNSEIERNKDRSKHYYTDDFYEEGLDIKGYDILTKFNYYQERDNFSTPKLCPPNPNNHFIKKSEISITEKPKELTIEYKKAKVATINLNRLFRKILNKKHSDKIKYRSPRFRNDFTQDEFTYRYKNNTVSIKLLLKSVDFSATNEVIGYNGILLFHYN